MSRLNKFCSFAPDPAVRADAEQRLHAAKEAEAAAAPSTLESSAELAISAMVRDAAVNALKLAPQADDPEARRWPAVFDAHIPYSHRD
jgi:anti-sigma-K factor RskA